MDKSNAKFYFREMSVDLAQLLALNRNETAKQREERVRREAIVIEQARKDIAGGGGISEEAFEAWLDDLERDENTPLPIPRELRQER